MSLGLFIRPHKSAQQTRRPRSGDMSTVLVSLTTCGWTSGMLLSLMVSGSLSLVTVHQPPVVTAPRGHDVVLPCVLQVSQDEQMESSAVLYWFHMTQDGLNPKLWSPSQEYQGRVYRLDNDTNSSNKSLLLKDVQWADGGEYLCKLSISTKNGGSFRTKGNRTSLRVHDHLFFGLHPDHASELSCAVNVTPGAGFVLSILRDGHRLQTTHSATGGAAGAPPYIMLTGTTYLHGGGKYECELRLENELIIKNVFYSSKAECEVVVHPEPWPLYAALLLVLVSVLLVLMTAAWCRRVLVHVPHT